MNKSKAATFFLSFLPGLGHLYLGLANRGIQLLIAFFAAAFFSDVFRFLGVMVPIIWFVSLFDALQQHTRIKETNEVNDHPFIQWGDVRDKQHIIGWALVLLGVFYLLERMSDYLFGLYFYDILRNIFIGIVLVYVGYRLVTGRPIFPVNTKKDHRTMDKESEER